MSNISSSSLQEQAEAIQRSIDGAKSRIVEKTEGGVEMSKTISRQLEEDKFIKMQRYEIFISKMEQLARAEDRQIKSERKAVNKMQSAYMESQQPLKDLLYYYNKASVKGFDASLVTSTLEQINLNLKARGNKPRVYDDYTTREFDTSWRMQHLASHIKEALSDTHYFNHHFMGKASRQLGEIGYKDVELIEKFFGKINNMLSKEKKEAAPLDFETAVYGSFMNFIPRHYVFEGFSSNKEFSQHLTTLLDWQVEKKDGLAAMKVRPTQEVLDLEYHMAKVINASNLVQDMQKDMQASIDSLRQQYFKLMEASDKHAFMKENKYIHYDLLELQNMLVIGGYLTPEEAEQMTASQPHDVRMDKAAQIFYEYVQNYAPELMSPQYDKFAKAALESQNVRTEKEDSISLSEEHDQINLSSLSRSLIGLSQQALSFRKEANDKDYLHKFYEEHTNQLTNNEEHHPMFEFAQNFESQNVSMERDYLKAWSTFETNVKDLWPEMKSMILNNRDDLEGQLHGLAAMSACKVDQPEVRLRMIDNISRLLKSGEKPRTEAILDGINGIAGASYTNTRHNTVAVKLVGLLGTSPQLSFDQKLDYMWSSCALGIEKNNQLVQDIYEELNSMSFERTDNDLTYQQFQKVKESLTYLTRVSELKDEKWIQSRNTALDQLIENPHYHNQRYTESLSNFDPFKKRVLEGLSRGLSQASIDHHMEMESSLFHQQEQEMDFNSHNYPFKVDLVMGYMGNKVLLNVIPSSQTMWDSKQPDGATRFRQTILKGLNKEKKVETVAIPITSVISYDIANLKLGMNSDYNFMNDINSQLSSNGKNGHAIDFSGLASFGSKFTGSATEKLASYENLQDQRRLDQFFKQLYKVFQMKQQTEKQYEKEIFQEGLDSLKLELMRLSLLFDQMPKEQRSYIQSHCEEGQNFKDLLLSQRDNIRNRIADTKPETDSPLDLKWMGTRSEVELPLGNAEIKKNIVPEIVNQRFMWVDDYFHYNDWENVQKSVYDSFNLLVVPRKEGEFKYFYDRQSKQRITPQGIFPPPNKKRQVLQSITTEVPTIPAGADELHLFEKEPYKMMVAKELNRSAEMKPVSGQVSFMTNLQNLKQGLKQDYSDKEILDLLLVNLKFTDKIIEQHMKGPQDGKKDDKKEKAPTYLNRDPACYREFIQESYLSKDQEDPFSHFYITEGGKVERVIKTFNEAKQSESVLAMKNVNDKKTSENAKSTLKTLSDKIDDMLLQNRDENEDRTSLSHHLGTSVEIKYDLRSLMKSDQVYDIDPELVDAEMSDEAFLTQQRKRAETKLIKTKIIYKMDQGAQLTQNEKKYLSQWTKQLQNKNVSLNNHRNTMLPKKSSGLQVKDALHAEDIFALNQVPGVEITREKHGGFAVNDLMLELSHFIDEDVINRVEMQMMSDKLKKDWDLPEHFQIIETRNKEIGITLNELEEVAWRMAGIYDDKDVDTLQKMFSITRNKDFFDQQFYAQDMQSMRDFVSEANLYDDREKLMEEWVTRKEQEIKSRINLPPKAWQKSDSELNQKIDSRLKKAREQLVGRFLDDKPKPYQDLTTKELASITESLCVRFHLFDGEYPAFMPQVVRAVMEHPNLSQTDVQKLTTFARMFELDWRADRSVENKKQFLATNPVYLGERDQSNFVKYGEIGNFEVTAMLRHACTPFVETLAEKLIKAGRN